jgi:phosphoadenosine phosphosulfate reductase
MTTLSWPVTRHEAPAPDPESLEQMHSWADEASSVLAGATAEEILQWAASRFGDGLVVTASMADGVMAHLAGQVLPGITVVFLDTGYHFAETLGTRDAIEATLPITVHDAAAPLTRAEHEAEFGPLYLTDPDLCCRMRKVWPLDKALQGYRAWATGVRRAESSTRAEVGAIAVDARRAMLKINPLYRWSDADVEAYAQRHGIIVNPLKSIGYASIGCAPCTRPVMDGEDARAGRWSGQAKSECGIHV